MSSTRRRRADWLAAFGFALFFAAPVLFTHDAFVNDFDNSLWLAFAQGHQIAATGGPSYFFHTTNQGIFNPYFAFYGGSLWFVAGLLGLALGSHYALGIGLLALLGAASAYGGSLWCARQAGIETWLAHIVALVFPTSAYYVTNLYGRGDIAEFMATSALPLVLASSIYLLRSERLRPLPLFAFLISVGFFTGSHNITLFYGVLFLAVASVIGLVLFRPEVSVLRIARVAALGIIAAGLNAWFLVPDVLYAGKTLLTAGWCDCIIASYFDRASYVFAPFRVVPEASAYRAIYIQAPDWFMLFAFVSGIGLWRRALPSWWRRSWIAAAATTAVIARAIMWDRFWKVAPVSLTVLQFAWRLLTYVTLAVAAMVLASVAVVERETTRDRLVLRGLAVAAAAVSCALCVWQMWIPRSQVGVLQTSRAEAIASPHRVPPTWYATTDKAFGDAGAPLVAAPAGRRVVIDPALVRGDRFSGMLALPSGTAPIETNIVAGSYLVRISGVRRLGRTAAGFTVVAREHPGRDPVHVVVEPARSFPLALARWVTRASVVAVLAIVFLVVLRSGSTVARRVASSSAYQDV